MIGIVNYKTGNFGTIAKILTRKKIPWKEIISSEDVQLVEKIIFPGVGHFGKAMQHLHESNLFSALNHAVIEQKKPVLGICLGMQIMAKNSEEGNEKGFGWIDADVVKFSVSDSYRFKIPHTGWNTASIHKESVLFKNVTNFDFYFVHGFHIVCHDKSDVLCTTTYDYEFVSSFQKNNIFAVQFHPEKSHQQGEIIFENFINLT